VKDVWRESCGFEAALAAISSLDGSFSRCPSTLAPPPRKDEELRTDLEGSGPGQGARASLSSLSSGRGRRPSREETQRRSSSDMSRDETVLMEAEHFRVIQAALFTLVASASAGPVAVMRGEQLVGYRANRRYLRREISYDSLTCCLVNSGVV
ncbi:unnamed protein product, partial [Sphacelaria rigidula]